MRKIPFLPSYRLRWNSRGRWPLEERISRGLMSQRGQGSDLTCGMRRR
jgi:hypothetical protein